MIGTLPSTNNKHEAVEEHCAFDYQQQQSIPKASTLSAFTMAYEASILNDQSMAATKHGSTLSAFTMAYSTSILNTESTVYDRSALLPPWRCDLRRFYQWRFEQPMPFDTQPGKHHGTIEA